MVIIKRVAYVFKADVNGVVDHLEDQGLMLKQHLRDMAEALNLKEIKLNRMCLSRKQAQQEYDRYSRQSEALERDLAVSLQKNKDEISRMLIRKIKPLNNLRDEIADHIRILDEEISNRKNLLDQQRLHYEQLKHRSIDFFHKSQAQEWRHEFFGPTDEDQLGGLSEEEIELELLKRKEARL